MTGNSENLLNFEERVFLLNLARQVIKNTANGLNYKSQDYFSNILSNKLGVFVTLHKDNDLRGCIGYVEGVKPLQDAVIDMAKSAAFNDPRFAPVSADEVDDLEIEISVLSPLTEIERIDEIEIGKHGLVVEQGFFKGLLLPQVATENNWNREDLVKNTCRKAGLSTDAWKDDDTRMLIFSAEIFSEKDFKTE